MCQPLRSASTRLRRSLHAGILFAGVFYLQWLALFILVDFDTYYECELTGLNNMCFYGSYPIFGNYRRSALAFLITWYESPARDASPPVSRTRGRRFTAQILSGARKRVWPLFLLRRVPK
eukprot:464080-Pleurochrysis_carterae.AAC.4